MNKETDTMTARSSSPMSARPTLRARLSVLVCAVAAAAVALPASALAASAPSVDAQTTNFSPQDISTSELLEAQVNPNGADTTYHFEYGSADCASNPCTSVPVPDAEIGAGSSDVAVSQRIAGLALSTTYHFRVVATSSAGTTNGADMTFATGKGFGIASFGVVATNQDGSLDTQAGSHPYQVTTNILFNAVTDDSGNTRPEGNVKDIITNLPPGLIGDPSRIPQCTEQQLAGILPVPAQGNVADCPPPRRSAWPRSMPPLLTPGTTGPCTTWCRRVARSLSSASISTRSTRSSMSSSALAATMGSR